MTSNQQDVELALLERERGYRCTCDTSLSGEPVRCPMCRLTAARRAAQALAWGRLAAEAHAEAAAERNRFARCWRLARAVKRSSSSK